jgi:hypothetical protein
MLFSSLSPQAGCGSQSGCSASLVSGARDEKEINEQDSHQDQCAKNDMEWPEAEHPPLPGRVWRRDMSLGMVMTVIKFRHDFSAKMSGSKSYRNWGGESSLQMAREPSGWKWGDCPALAGPFCAPCP